MLLGALYPTNTRSDDLSLYQRVEDRLKINNCIAERQELQNLNVTSFYYPNQKSKALSIYVDDTLSVIVNGNIYGLDKNLINHFEDVKNPAEMIAKLFPELGAALFNQLNGDYSIIIHNRKSEETFFVKDHMGIVPLAVAIKDDTLFFSSDMNGLSSALYGKEQIDEEFIQSLFFEYEENYSYTPNSNVIRILPGHYISHKGKKIEQIKYWFPEIIEENGDISFEEAADKLKDLVLDAVRIRCNKDYIVGSHLSGGLDSSLVSTLVRSEYPLQDKFYCFTWSPSVSTATNIPYDERDVVRKESEKLGAILTYTDIDVSDYEKYANEWKSPSELLFEGRIQEKAAQLGIGLIFSGWGGDEFIGLRDEALLRENLRKGRIGTFLKVSRKKGLTNKLKAIINAVILPNRKPVYFKYKIRPDAYIYLNNLIPSNQLKANQRNWLQSKNAYQLGLIEYHHLSQRCEDWYIQGQRLGIEYRYPLIDKRIIEYCLSLPVELYTGKAMDRPLMREVCKDYLIPDIVDNMKQLDPVLMKNASEVEQAAIKNFIKELDIFEENEYLKKVHFKLLRSDIQKIDQEAKRIPRPIANVVFNLKRTNEYTKQYHS